MYTIYTGRVRSGYNTNPHPPRFINGAGITRKKRVGWVGFLLPSLTV